MTEKTRKSVSKQHVLICLLSFIIPIMVSFIGLIRGGFAPFGTKDIMTCGDSSNLVPYYMELWDKVHSGSSLLWSTKSGLGYDFTTVITFYLSDPLNLLILLFRRSDILSVLNILYSFKLGLAGLFFSFYLIYHNSILTKTTSSLTPVKAKNNEKSNFVIGGQNEPSSTLGKFLAGTNLYIPAISIAYALSSYMLGAGMNASYLSSIILLPLILLGFERLANEKKWIFYTITFALSIYLNFYISVIITIFMLIYSILYNYKDFSVLLNRIFIKLISDILAIGLAAPSILNNLKSDLFANHNSLYFPTLGQYTSIFDVIKMQLTGISPSRIMSSAHGINIYCGIFIILFFICFILNRNIEKWYKLKMAVLYLLLLSATFISTTNYLFNGLKKTNSIHTTFAFVFIALALTLAFESLIYLPFTTSKVILFSGFITFATIIASLVLCTSYDSINPFVTSLEFIFIYYIILILWKNNSLSKLIFNIVFPLIMLIEIIISYSGNIKQMGLSNKAYNETMSYKIDSAENYIKSFDSEARILYYVSQASDSTPVSNMLLGYDYIVASENDTDLDKNLELLENFNGVNIYKNPLVVKSGFYVNEDIIDWNSNSLFPYTTLNLLTSKYINSEKVFDITTGSVAVQSLAVYDGIDDENYITNVRNLFTYFLDSSGDFYTNMSHIIHVGDAIVGEEAGVIYTTTQEDIISGRIGGELAIFKEDKLNTLYNDLIENNGHFDNSSVTLSININAPSDGYLLLPYTMAQNWSCSNSRSIISKELLSSNLTLVKLDKGNNSFSISYVPHGLYYGSIIALIALFMVITRIVFSNKKTTKRNIFKTIKTRFTAFCIDNRVYIYTLFLSIAIYTFLLMINQCVPFGSKSTISSDGYVQVYPEYTKILSNFKNANFSVLDYSRGYWGGGTTIKTLLYFIFPYKLIGFLFPNESSLLAVNAVFFLTFISIGPSLIFYLTNRPNSKNMDKHNLYLVPIALAYNFCSFAISFYPYSCFLEVALFTPLIILAMEKLLYEKKIFGYIIFLAYIMIWNYYMAFLICEFLALYFFVQHFESIKDFFTKGIRFALCSILPAVIAAFTLLPNYTVVQNVGYSERDNDIPSFSLSNTLLTNFRDFKINHRTTMVTEDFTSANAYCGILVLLFVALYILNKRINLSIRIRKALLAFFLYFSFGNELMNFVLHGFHKQAMVPNRFSIFFVFLLITMFYDCLIDIQYIYSKSKLAVFTIFSIIICILMVYCEDESNIIGFISISSLFILIYCIIYIIGIIMKNKKKATNLLLVVLCIEIFISSILASRSSFGLGDIIGENDIVKISELSREHGINNEKLTRTELINSGMRNIGLLTDIQTVSIFTSTLSSNTTNLSKYWNTMAGVNVIEYDFGNPLGNMMLNVRYFLTNDFYDVNTCPDYIKEIDSRANLHLYEDPGYVGNGIFFNNDILSSISKIETTEYTNCFDRQNAFTQLLIGKDLYNIVDVVTDIEDTGEDASYIMMADENEDGSVPVRVFTAKDITGNMYLSSGPRIYYMGQAEAEKQNSYEFELNSLSKEDLISDVTTIAVLNEDTLLELKNYLSKSHMQNFKYGSDTIEGDISCTEDGQVYISLPYNNNWKAYVDGNEVQIAYTMAGLGIPCNTGNHHILLKYSPVKNYTGTIISYIGIIILIILIFIHKKRKNHLVDVEETEITE